MMISQWKFFSVNGALELIYTDTKVASLTPKVTLSLSTRMVMQPLNFSFAFAFT